MMGLWDKFFAEAASQVSFETLITNCKHNHGECCEGKLVTCELLEDNAQKELCLVCSAFRKSLGRELSSRELWKIRDLLCDIYGGVYK